MFQIAIDTNVIVSALMSKKGASYQLFSMIGLRQFDNFEINLSVALALEYEEVLLRNKLKLGLSDIDVSDIVNFLCENSNQREIFYLWRPTLDDEDDDFLLELAIESNCDFIVTFNEKDFVGSERFGIRILRPNEFLKVLGEQNERN